jgi:RNA polymerase sigma factor (sigma-70 family)
VPAATIAVDAAFRAHERVLWQLCYRMTGIAADADDLVQETFVRAMERPPSRLGEDLRPWLVRVALNLARDFLRRRRQRAYVGPWLPSPIETPDDEPAPAVEALLPGAGTTEGRYDLLESVSFAFLLALEALTPQQRAVLLLRDVFDYSARDAAETLGLSEANVRVVHLRARRAMAAYNRRRRPTTRALQDATRRALATFMEALRAGDVAAVEALLADDVRHLSDGGGEFPAARRPILGRSKVARYLVGLAGKLPGDARLDVRMLNGLPTLFFELPHVPDRQAARLTVQLELTPDGRVAAVYAVLASRKLTALTVGSSAGDRAPASR